MPTLKRLKSYFLRMDADTSTYRLLYEGPVVVVTPYGNEADSRNTDWHGDCSVTVTTTHKLAPDRTCAGTISGKRGLDRAGCRRHIEKGFGRVPIRFTSIVDCEKAGENSHICLDFFYKMCYNILK